MELSPPNGWINVAIGAGVVFPDDWIGVFHFCHLVQWCNFYWRRQLEWGRIWSMMTNCRRRGLTSRHFYYECCICYNYWRTMNSEIGSLVVGDVTWFRWLPLLLLSPVCVRLGCEVTSACVWVVSLSALWGESVKACPLFLMLVTNYGNSNNQQ